MKLIFDFLLGYLGSKIIVMIVIWLGVALIALLFGLLAGLMSCAAYVKKLDQQTGAKAHEIVRNMKRAAVLSCVVTTVVSAPLIYFVLSFL